MVQEELAASDVPQVLVEKTKDLVLAPVKVGAVKVMAVAPVFLRVMVCVAVATPTGDDGKARLCGVMARVGVRMV